MTAKFDDTAPRYEDVTDAANRLKGVAVRTPLLSNPALDEICGGRVFLKAECLQHTGSFKFRGAYNRISRLSEGERQGGVVAYSSGNHAQAVAAVAKRLGMAASIVMPSDAPALKIEATRNYGADIVLYDRYSDSREEIAAAIALERGATLIPPFENRHIIAGQGTAGLEAMEELTKLKITPNRVLVPCSGGGLVAGIALAVKHHFPDASIHPVEPEGFDDTARSLVSGNRETGDQSSRSICDALLVPTPGELTFSINRRLLSDGFVVTDKMVLAAMAFAFRHLKLVLEPGGAVALAAVLNNISDCRNQTVVVVLSGGNVDPALYAEALKITA
jgi:threonine dehydratase